MENRFIRADDVARELDVSKPYAYKLIRQLNEELKAKGFVTIAGRVNRQYFYERLYGAGNPQRDTTMSCKAGQEKGKEMK
ncbi:MAG: LysR family transcriptional regulator [Lachnospiraceae bacterium]